MLNSLFSRKKTDSHSSLEVEALESRMMLSTVSIFAAGQTGQENLDLFIDDQYVKTFNNVGGDVGSRDFVELTFQTNEVLTPGRIGVAFGNDFYDPNTGEDRNLLVDKIVVDGVSIETEDPSTHSTGIWRQGLTGPGNFETELFNINAIFTYADPVGQADRVEFVAAGTTGEEIVELVIDDQVVSTFNFRAAGVAETFSFDAVGDVSLEDIEIRFVNDFFDPATGLDRNVQIFRFFVTDGETGRVETAFTIDDDVLSTGIFVEGEGITSGFGVGGFLAGNGSVRKIANEVVDETTLSTTIESIFENDSASPSIETAVGPDNQVASITNTGELTLLDDAGNSVSTFGDNGSVNLNDLLAQRVGGNPSFTDLEFFDDGSILVSGSVLRLFGGVTPITDPFIVKLSEDGSLDESLSQQGIVPGTFLQLSEFNNDLKSVIDNDGRIILFGSNGTSAASSDYAISRLNPDGTLDPTFGNRGNVFISASEAGIGSSSSPADVEVLADNRVVFGVVTPVSRVVGILNENGSLDLTFGDGGFASFDLPEST